MFPVEVAPDEVATQVKVLEQNLSFAAFVNAVQGCSKYQVGLPMKQAKQDSICNGGGSTW